MMIRTCEISSSTLGAWTMRTTLAALLAFAFMAAVCVSFQNSDVQAQAKKKAKAKEADVKKDEPKTEPVEEKFDQKKADIETLRAANMPFDGKALLDFYKQHTVTDADRARLGTLIKQLGDDDFDKREQASDEIEKFGVAAIGLLRQAERSGDVEVLRRCERCLKSIEKVPTRTLAAAAARLLADLKPEGTSEVLLKYLPLAEDEAVGDDVRLALAAVAVKDGKPDPVLKQALESKEALKRGAAAEAFARGGDKAARDDMRKRIESESDGEIRLRIAMALVTAAKDKSLVENMIKAMPDAPFEIGWRAEEILVRLAGEKGPTASFSGDRSAKDKAATEWLTWWKANEKDVDLAKLDEIERTLGYTLLVEMDIRGIGGRLREIGPDGKNRWEITNVQFPTDAIVLPGNRVIVAEQNNNRISERDTSKNGQEIWGTTFNQPVGLQKLPNGNLIVVGRNQMVEWDRNRRAVTTITRNQYDIVAGLKMRNGEFAVYTQQGQLITFDKDGKQLGVMAAGRPNYNATMQILPNGSLLVTQQRGVAEIDLAKKESKTVMTYNFPTSAQKLPNGNILVANQNNYQVVEIDPKNNKVIWEHKPDNNANNFYRAWRAKKR
jgi:PQQ-like domain